MTPCSFLVNFDKHPHKCEGYADGGADALMQSAYQSQLSDNREPEHHSHRDKSLTSLA